MSYITKERKVKRSFWARLWKNWSRVYEFETYEIWVDDIPKYKYDVPKKPKLKLYDTTSVGGYKPAPKPKTVYYSPPPAPAPVVDNTTDVLLGAAVGFAIGRLLDDDKPSYSCPAPSPAPFESGGGGDFGGGGASDSWSSDDSSSSSGSD